MGDGPADIVFHGGDIFTLDDKNPQVEALAVKGEVILAIGNYTQTSSPKFRAATPKSSI